MSSFPGERLAAPSRLDTLRRQSTSTSLRTSRSALDLLAGSHSPSQGHATTALASDPMATPSVASSASSAVNVSIDDGASGIGVGMVVVGGDALEVEGELVVPAPVGDGDGDAALRETLKKTLMQSNDMTQRAKRDRSFSMVGGAETPLNIANTATTEVRVSPKVHKPRQYFVLTSAGKPVFVSRRGSSKTTDDDITSAMGIMQAIISIYADDGDKIRCINAGSTRITFLLRPPLYYVCVSAWGEPESVTRLHLEYLHLQILSVVTGSQLSRIFEKRTNFDLRRLLDGTERFLHSLLAQIELDMGMVTSSLNVVRIDAVIRGKVAEVMVPPKDLKDLLYILLLADNRVVTLVRPKKHSVHPADLHILLNTLARSSLSSVTGPDASTWLPICLPKFNPNGFLHTYVSYLTEPEGDKATRPALVEQKTKPLIVSGVGKKDEGGAVEDLTSPVDVAPEVVVETSTPDGLKGEDVGSRQSPKDGLESVQESKGPEVTPPIVEAPKISLAVVTADREGFEKVRDWASKIITTLTKQALLKPVFDAAKTHDILCSSLGIPGLRHFIYKSRSHVQLVVPAWEEPYADEDEKRRLTTLYQVVHDAIHARSGQPGGPLKLYFIKTDEECMLGWITTPFELYVTTSPKLPKSAVVSAANAVSRWVKKHETELVLRDAPVF